MQVRVLDPGGHVRDGVVTGDVVDVGADTFHFDEVVWLPPAEPTKIVCLARNVAAHAAEHDAEVPDRPEYFLKPPSSLAAHGGTVRVPRVIDSIEYEAELAAVVDTQVRNVDEDEALDYVAGLTCLNDLSNRYDQRQELNWVRGKAFDGAAPVGPGIVPASSVPDDGTIELRIDGEVQQTGRRDEYEFDLPTTLADLSQYLTLEPGDIIALGTTAGVGQIPDGATVTVDIEGIPPLRHRVVYSH